MRAPLLIPALLLALACALIVPRCTPALPKVDKKASISAVVERSREGEERGVRSTVIVDSINGNAVTPFRAQVFLDFDDRQPSPGSRILFINKLEAPYAEADLPYETPQKSLYDRRGISATGFIPSSSIISETQASGFQRYVNDMRQKVVDMLVDSPGLSDGASSFLLTALISDDNYLPAEERLQWSRAGLAHVLAVSGMHVGIILGLVMIATWPLALLGWRRPRYIIALVALWLFALLAGMGPSVCRAAIMLSVFLIAKIDERESNSMNSLALAAIVVLLWHPNDVFSPGFQLSFLATAAIILGMPPTFSLTQGLSRTASWFVGLTAMTFWATLATAPVVAWHFHIFPLTSFISCFAAAVATPLLLGGGLLLITSTALGLSGVALLLSHIVDAVYRLLHAVVVMLAADNSNVVSGLVPEPWQMVGWALMAIGLLMGAYLAMKREDMTRSRINGRLLALSATMACGLFLFLLPSKVDTPPSPERYSVANLRGVVAAEVRGDTLVLETAPNWRGDRAGAAREARRRWEEFILRRGIQEVVWEANDGSSAK